MIAEYHAKKGQRVTIVVPNDELQDHFEEKISEYSDNLVTVIQPRHLPLHHHNEVYLFDEADAVIE